MSESCSDFVVTQQRDAQPPPIALGINVEKPKFPQYAVYAKRLKSFEVWPEYLPVEKEDLVEAGLVYTGVGDSVRCYFCGGGLRNWERGDVPMEEHAKWYPKCPHMLLVKGQAYVEKLGRGEKPDEHEPLVQTGVTEARPSCLESVAAQSCVEMGYAIDMVQRAIDYFIEHNGNIDFKGKDLCEVLFKIECEEDQQAACVTDKIVDSKVTADQEEDQEEQTPDQIETLKQENQRLRENQMCKICLDKRADVIFLPCGHMVSCPQCAPALAKCPICRKPVNGQIKAFFAVRRALSQWV